MIVFSKLKCLALNITITFVSKTKSDNLNNKKKIQNFLNTISNINLKLKDYYKTMISHNYTKNRAYESNIIIHDLGLAFDTFSNVRRRFKNKCLIKPSCVSVNELTAKKLLESILAQIYFLFKISHPLIHQHNSKFIKISQN